MASESTLRDGHLSGAQRPSAATAIGRSGDEPSFFVSAPAVNLPKGGGAIRGIGETFAANPATGSATFSIPLPVSPGRGGFTPQLTLGYDSGNPNGLFGFGWELALRAVSRSTENGNGLPRYAGDHDTFLISGAENLVPALDANNRLVDDTTSVPGFAIRRYRPRVEGSFARIERWTRARDGDVHWRAISADNVLSIFGADPSSRIADPLDATRIFSWLIAEERDDKGNGIVYEYKAEAGRGVNRHLKRILYGNRRSLLDTATARRPRDVTPARLAGAGWMFELMLDYGEHDGFDPLGAETWRCSPDLAGTGEWDMRPDPFSSYRAGFEIRTSRLCRRVLMVHHFPQDADVGANCLVRSLEFGYRGSPADRRHSDPGFSFLERVSQRRYQREANTPGAYRYGALPPLEFTYSEAAIDAWPRDLDPGMLEHLPAGIGREYRWVDLDGEGLSGILTEQAGGWYYTSNLGAGPSGPTFAPPQLVAPRPATAALASGSQQLLDVDGSGQIALVDFNRALAGFHQRDASGGWRQFVPFDRLPNIDWGDPNLRFVDLTGDGRADALITEGEVFTWYASEAERGFSEARRTALPLDERDGPRVVFSDQTEAIYLADMSGDGLSDIVRVRNGQICYFPNLGWGRWGRQVIMDGSPWFAPDGLFDQARVRLADIDGSGTVDIIYLGADGARVWFNRSGNGWSDPRDLPFPMPSANVDQIQVADLFGNGTACLVWSSELPRDARQPMRYLDLMGGVKPHLLTKVSNNLGAETEVRYTPSTTYYIRDKRAGVPWATKLPFPVQCVSTVIVRDQWRKTEFSTEYSYHHGFYDGAERQFRGFGRAESVDTQRFDDVVRVNAASPYVTNDLKLFQPPVKTITWFHTGVAADRRRILGLFEQEYFPAVFADRLPAGPFVECELPEPAIELRPQSPPLDTDEWREAMRACRGMTLRQEVYELDVDALHARGEHRYVRLFSAAQHSCHIRRVQPRGPNRHAVFLVTESEAITYQYELALAGAGPLEADPRVSHALNLRFDDYGRAVQAVVVGYPRPGQFGDAPLDPAPLTAGDVILIRTAQDELHVAYSEAQYTDELPGDAAADHRLPAMCEARTYELIGLSGSTAGRYVTLEGLREYEWNAGLDTQATRPVVTLAYEERPRSLAVHKRLVEHAVTLFFDDALSGPRALGQPSRLGLVYEQYKLALTNDLLDAVFPVRPRADDCAAESRTELARAGARAGFLASGYQRGTAVLGARGSGQWWVRSGVAGFAADADRHFFLPERYLNPFGYETVLAYDADDLFVTSSTDPLGNATSVVRFDHRVLAPRRLKDPNDNVTAAAFDVLGLPVVTAVMGKVSPGPPESSETGETTEGFSFADLNPPRQSVAALFLTAPFDVDQARRWLRKATARFVYHFGESVGANGRLVWGAAPAGACGIVRELRERAVPNTPARSVPVRASIEYSDGSGQTFVTRSQAEPDPVTGGRALRWIASAKTVVNNKGNTVLQYEPYFSTGGHRFAEPQRAGVSPIMYYDAPGRLIRTEFPDGSFSRIEFSPWVSRSYDANDTVLEPGNQWYATHTAAAASPDLKRAAQRAARHAGTPSESHLDSLGRAVFAIERNRRPDAAGAPPNATSMIAWPWIEERLVTFTKLDSEGDPLWIRDARGNQVMEFAYDIAGTPLFQRSMDAGERRMLSDAAGQPLLAWDYNERTDATTPQRYKEHRRVRVRYDALHRPLERWLRVRDEDTGAANESLVERFRYGEAAPANRTNNLRGQLWQHFDSSGVAQTDAFDVANMPLVSRRRLARDIPAPIRDWSGVALNNVHAAAAPAFERDVFTQRTEYDALARITTHYNWHVESPANSGTSSRVAVHSVTYNERGLLASQTIRVRARKTPGGYDVRPGITRRQVAIARIDYDAKGQRVRIERGNGTITAYNYDLETFRLRELRTTRPGYAPAFPSPRGQLSDARVLQHLYYTYDPSGNVTEIEDNAWSPAFFRNQQVDAAARYVYDALYRLVEATGRENGAAVGAPPRLPGAPVAVAAFPVANQGAVRNYTERYAYDSVGNIQSIRHIASSSGAWTRTHTYASSSNRLTGTDTDNPQRSVAYAYDVHGSMLNLEAAPARFDLRWDWNDMVHTIDLGGGGRAWYQYSADKQRCRKRIDRQHGSTGYWQRIYLNGYELYRRYATATALTPVEEIESHHVMDSAQRLLLVDDVIVAANAANPRPDGVRVAQQTRFRYQYGNHLGSACLEIDENADVISYEEYHPYGSTAYQATTSGVDAPPKRYRYTGMERDEESGLYVSATRYFVPSISRWASPDSAGLVDGPNVYAYVGGQPISLVDPQGTAGTGSQPTVRDIFADPNPQTHTLFNGRVEPNITGPKGPSTETGRYLNIYLQSAANTFEGALAFTALTVKWLTVDFAGSQLYRATKSESFRESHEASRRGALAFRDFIEAGPVAAGRGLLVPLDEYNKAFARGDTEAALAALGEAVPNLAGAGDLLTTPRGPIINQPKLVTAEGAVFSGGTALAGAPPPSLAGATMVAASAASDDPGGASDPAQGTAPASPQVTSGINLTSSPVHLQAGILFQGVVDRAGSFLFGDPGRFRTVLTPSEYALGRSEYWAAPIFIGTGIERYTAQVARMLKLPFEHLAGPYNPDFLGTGRLSGFIFDVFPNTDASLARHMSRPYGRSARLIPGVYQRPFGLHLLP
jgi:RHS repeat-associated protein